MILTVPLVPVSSIETDVLSFWTAETSNTAAVNIPATLRLPTILVSFPAEGSMVISPVVEATVLPDKLSAPTLREVGLKFEVFVPSVTSISPVTSSANVVDAKLTAPVS